jgi:hypothetical protein
MEDRQKNVRVVKETLSKVFFYLQESNATIEKQKYEWDANQDNSFNEGLDVAHLKGAFTRDALRALKTNLTFELLVALKDWESKEFQISKKANAQKNVCDAFEE